MCVQSFATQASAAELAAAYEVPSAPGTLGAGASTAVTVNVRNTGSSAWTAGGSNPVRVAYHWYDSTGRVVVWDGARSALPADVPPGGAVSISAEVLPPPATGTFALRFALVKEGIAWFEPEPTAHNVTISGALSSAFGTITLPRFVAGTASAATVNVSNTGSATWNAAAPNPVRLTYHWFDLQGRVVVWDGVRSALAADVAPGAASAPVSTTIEAPVRPGTYLLAFEMVREGVAWFGNRSQRQVTVESGYRGAYVVGTPGPVTAYTAETRTVSVTVKNTGDAPWPAGGANPVRLSYHWYDANGRVVVWDGVRTALPADLPAGGERTLDMTVVTPGTVGSFTLKIDLVLEGYAWFSGLGSEPASLGFNVSNGYSATYGADNMPASVLTSTDVDVTVQLTNTGPRTWSAAGANPVRLSYHWYDAAGQVIIWDGNRGALPKDVAPGEQVSATVRVRTPARTGSLAIGWDLVHEGMTWFSWQGVAVRRAAVTVSNGYAAAYGADSLPTTLSMGSELDVTVQVTNTGPRTWVAGGANPTRLSYHWFNEAGHLVVAEGRRGVLPKDVAPGESVSTTVRVAVPNAIATYVLGWDLVHEGVTWFSAQGVAMKRVTVSVPGVIFFGKGWGHGVGMSQWGAQGWATGASGTALNAEQIVTKYYTGASITALDPSTQFRILLSSPSTACIGRTITSIAQMRSQGGIIVRDAADHRVLVTTAPMQTVRFTAQGNTLRVVAEWTGATLFSGAGVVLVGPLDAAKPVIIDQKSPSADHSLTDPKQKKMYRGGFRVDVSAFNSLRVINYVSPDDYTRGAIPAEMPTTTGWHLEAFKSQAYAARTYAAFHRNHPKNGEWDQYDDTKDQCYGGFSVETPATDQATAATAMKVLTHNGAVINAYYSSSNGGVSEMNGCVWNLQRVGSTYACGGSEPYLAVIQDPADLAAGDNRGPQPHRSWSVVFTPDQLRAAVLSASGVDIGTFVSIDLSNRSPSGRAISVRIRGTAASVDLRADSFLRSNLALKSTLVRNTPF